jgi:hypothetical protein
MVDDLEALEETIAVRSDSEAMRQLVASDAELARARGSRTRSLLTRCDAAVRQSDRRKMGDGPPLRPGLSTMPCWASTRRLWLRLSSSRTTVSCSWLTCGWLGRPAVGAGFAGGGAQTRTRFYACRRATYARIVALATWIALQHGAFDHDSIERSFFNRSRRESIATTATRSVVMHPR